MVSSFVVFDIETTKYRELIQIAYNIYTFDFKKVLSKSILVNDGIGKTDFFQRFSLEDIQMYGVDSATALSEFIFDIEKAKCKYCVGHNIIQFDIKVLHKYLDKYQMAWKFPEPLDTMKLTKTFVNSKGVRGQPKWPKLSELYVKCFGISPDSEKQHTADYDIEINFLCFKFLVENTKILPPELFSSSNLKEDSLLKETDGCSQVHETTVVGISEPSGMPSSAGVVQNPEQGAADVDSEEKSAKEKCCDGDSEQNHS